MSLDSDSLLVVLDTNCVPPELLDELPKLPDEAKDVAVSRIADAPTVASAHVLARLPFIRTSRNEAAMLSVIRAGLRSTDPSARKYAIYGLEELGAADLTVAAVKALEDDDDQVVAAAITVLLPAAAEPQIAEELRRTYDAIVGKDEFYLSTSLLEARLIEPGGSA
jgi:hypothetical protein